MKIIFALGNPGADYTKTRHNVGWYYVDAFANARSVEFVAKSKFHAMVAELSVAGEKCLLVKPTTFYNDTGMSARAIADFYKLSPEDFLIIHDDLALPIGTLRTRIGGSSAGNNGIKSLNAHLGDMTARLRIGILDAEIPRDALDSVLGKFNSDETKRLKDMTSQVFEVFNDFIASKFQSTTHKK